MTTPKRTTAETTPPWEQGPESEGLTFGTWLRRQREVREVGLREVAEASKISLRYLEAFEQDRFDLLPAPVFSRGFLRQYSLYVGLDADDVLNYFLWAQGQEEPAENEPETPEYVAPKEASLLPWLLGGGIILLLGLIVLLVWWSRRGDTEAAPPDSPTEAFLAPASEPVVPVPEPVPPPPSEPAAPLRVSLEFVRNCWVEAVVDGGARRIAQEFAQGESLQIDAEREVAFRKLGNAAGVKMEVNGEEFPLRGSEGDLLKDLVINLDTARALEGAPGTQGSPATAEGAAAGGSL